MPKVMLDTSFLIRLVNKNESLHSNSYNYFKYFLEKKFDMACSTIAIAEYCVGDSYSNIPVRNIQILPFNFDHAIKAGEYAKCLFEQRKAGNLTVSDRKIIPNDTKMFAQSEIDSEIKYFACSDTECQKIYDTLVSHSLVTFDFIDISIPYQEYFGILPFDTSKA